MNNSLLKSESETNKSTLNVYYTVSECEVISVWTTGSNVKDWPLQSPGIVQDRLQVCEAERSVEAVPIPVHLPHGGKLAAEILTKDNMCD